MMKLLGLCYILTILIGVAAFSVHLTARGKCLTASSRLVVEKSTTVFLILVLLFNFCDFLIFFLEDALRAEQLVWIYVAENLLELALAYAIIMVSRDYVEETSPRWLAGVFWGSAVVIFYGDSIFTLGTLYHNEQVYAVCMAVLNAIPILLQSFFVLRYFQIALRRGASKGEARYLLHYYLFGVLLCIVATASIIDSRTSHDFIGYDKEIYIVMWLVFNILNYLFIWRSCQKNQSNSQIGWDLLSEEEQMQQVSEVYCLSEREREIAQLIIEGKNNKEMAELLYLSPNTVKVHASNLYRKLGVSNRVQAVQILSGKRSPIDGKGDRTEMRCGA